MSAANRHSNYHPKRNFKKLFLTVTQEMLLSPITQRKFIMKQPGCSQVDSSPLKCQFRESFHKDTSVTNDSERSAGGRGRVVHVPRRKAWVTGTQGQRGQGHGALPGSLSRQKLHCLKFLDPMLL